jgi:hypothetical protein
MYVWGTIAGVAFLVIALVHIARKLIETSTRRRRLQILARVKAIGPQFCRNEVADVEAVCTLGDFSVAYNRFRKDVEEGKRKMTDRVVLWVNPTLTFWKNGAQTLMHTGPIDVGENFFQSLARDLLCMQNITKEEMEEVGLSWDDVLSFLVVTDGRLFVPFAGGMPKLEEQMEFYGRWKSHDDLFKHFRAQCKLWS